MGDSMVTALWPYDSAKVARTTLFRYGSSNINAYSTNLLMTAWTTASTVLTRGLTASALAVIVTRRNPKRRRVMP